MEAMNANAGQAATGAGVERVDSVLLGGALLSRGLTRLSLARGALMLVGGVLLYRGISGRCYLYQALGMSTARRYARRQVERSITIGRSAAELYRFWHELGNRNRIMGHLAEVTAASKERTHWRVRGPLWRSLEWDAQVVEDRPGEYLLWASLAGANESSISFRPAVCSARRHRSC